MRKIKFRGLSLSGNNWLFGQYARSWRDDEHYMLEDLSHIGGSEWGADADTVRGETVGQFTGEVDKKGTEIYEGDIVVAKTVERSLFKPDHVSGYLKGVVEYYSATFCLLTKSGTYHPHWLNAEEIEVIGNIHQNPELLED